MRQNQQKSLKGASNKEGVQKESSVFPRGGSGLRCQMLLTSQDEEEVQATDIADVLSLPHRRLLDEST